MVKQNCHRTVLTRDLIESIRTCLGRTVKISMKSMVRIEGKSEKHDNRVLVFSSCRLFILAAKVPTKIEHNFHYLDIQAVESRTINQITLQVLDKRYCYVVNEDHHEEIDAMIINLGVSIKNIFSSVPLNYVIGRIDVIPSSRIQKLYEVCQLIESRDSGPCGGFSIQYACMCDYYGLPYRDEVAWDVDTIYHSNDCREMKLHDFNHLNTRDLIPVVSALEHNTWFTSLRLSGLRYNLELLDRVLSVLRNSVSLEEIHLDNIGFKSDFILKMVNCLMANSNSILSCINLSGNYIEDKGAVHIATLLSSATLNISELNLIHSGLSSKSIGHVCNAMASSRSLVMSLKSFYMSGNSVKDELSGLLKFFSLTRTLTNLSLADCDIVLDNLFVEQFLGCTVSLQYLDVSRNSFNTKKSRELPLSFKKFFSVSSNIKKLSFSSCRFTNDALKHLLLGLACNSQATNVILDLSMCALATPNFTNILESCLHGVSCLTGLNIADNGIEHDMIAIVSAAAKNTSLRSLDISRNLTQVKAKHVPAVIESIIQLIHDDNCLLEELFLSDCRLKCELYAFLNALGSNNSLQVLDISGNLFGDTGARLLAKALQINTRLKKIFIDRNHITSNGYFDIYCALNCNQSLVCIPAPLFDLSLVSASQKNAVYQNPERKVELIWQKIEDVLHSNSTSFGMSTCHNQEFKVHQSFLLTSTHQLIDRLLLQMRSCNTGGFSYSNRSLLADESFEECANAETSLSTELPSDGVISPIQQTEILCSQAEKSKLLVSKLHTLVVEKQQDIDHLHSNLDDCFDQLSISVSDHMQGLLSSLLELADQWSCQPISEHIRDELLNYMEQQLAAIQHSLRHALTKLARARVHAHITDLHLRLATRVCDRIVNHTVSSLMQNYRNLTDNSVGYERRVSTPDMLNSYTRTSTMESNSSFVPADTDSAKVVKPSELSTEASPLPGYWKMNYSINQRKLRPKSIADFINGISAEQVSDLLDDTELSANVEEGMDTVAELTSANHCLNHIVKSRPRRIKKHLPSTISLIPLANCDASTPTATTTQLSDVSTQKLTIDEGLEDFFTSRSPQSQIYLDTPLRIKNKSKNISSPSSEENSSSSRFSITLRKGLSSMFTRLSSDRSNKCKSFSQDKLNKKSPLEKDTTQPANDSGTFLNHIITPTTTLSHSDLQDSSQSRTSELGYLSGDNKASIIERRLSFNQPGS